MSKKQVGFLTLNFLLVTLSMLCQNVATQMLNTTLSPFANYIWQSKSLGGLLTSFFNIGSIVMAFLSAPLIEKIGKKKSIILFSALYAISTLLFIFMPTQNVTLSARVLQGIGKGVITVACASVVADITPKEQMNEGMGLFGLGATFAMAFGPMIALNAVGSKNNYNLMFTLCAVIAAMGALFAFGMKLPKTEKAIQTTKYQGIDRLIERKALLPSVNYTIFFAGFACILVFSSVYAQEILGLSGQQISLFYLAAAAAMLLVRLFGGKMADRYGELVMIVPGHLCMVGVLLLFVIMAGSEHAFPLFILCGVLYGVGNAAVQPSMNAIAVVDSPSDRSSVANATFYFLMDFGILFSSSVFGSVIDSAASSLEGYRITFYASIAITLFSMVLAIVCLNPKAREKRKNKEKQK